MLYLLLSEISSPIKPPGAKCQGSGREFTASSSWHHLICDCHVWQSHLPPLKPSPHVPASWTVRPLDAGKPLVFNLPGVNRVHKLCFINLQRCQLPVNRRHPSPGGATSYDRHPAAETPNGRSRHDIRDNRGLWPGVRQLW